MESITFFAASNIITRLQSCVFYKGKKEISEKYFLNNAPVKVLISHRNFSSKNLFANVQ